MVLSFDENSNLAGIVKFETTNDFTDLDLSKIECDYFNEGTVFINTDEKVLYLGGFVSDKILFKKDIKQFFTNKKFAFDVLINTDKDDIYDIISIGEAKYVGCDILEYVDKHTFFGVAFKYKHSGYTNYGAKDNHDCTINYLETAKPGWCEIIATSSPEYKNISLNNSDANA